MLTLIAEGRVRAEGRRDQSRPMSGTQQPVCTSTATSGSTRRAWPPALPQNGRLAAERGPTVQLTQQRMRRGRSALWANTTLGLISFWWTGGRQQQGRSVMPIRSCRHLLTLDAPHTRRRKQIDRSRRIFTDFLDHDFSPPTRPTTTPPARPSTAPSSSTSSASPSPSSNPSPSSAANGAPNPPSTAENPPGLPPSAATELVTACDHKYPLWVQTLRPPTTITLSHPPASVDPVPHHRFP